jgi:hypothetical protein
MLKSMKFVALLGMALSLNACASMNVFKDSASDQAVNAAPIAPPIAAPAPVVPTTLSAAQIKTLLTGKSWRWKSAKNSGVTLYASDGTSLVEVTGKGTTQGRWVARNGQLCESFSPAPFIPQGMSLMCQPFTGSGGSYMNGPATFSIAS